jgi:hypothetical protein
VERTCRHHTASKNLEPRSQTRNRWTLGIRAISFSGHYCTWDFFQCMLQPMRLHLCHETGLLFKIICNIQCDLVSQFEGYASSRAKAAYTLFHDDGASQSVGPEQRPSA